MATEDGYWVDRAQTAEAKLATCQENQDRVIEKFRDMMETLAARELSDGSVDIDFVALAGKLSLEHALALRQAIDDHHHISGDAGEKPKVRVGAGQAS